MRYTRMPRPRRRHTTLKLRHAFALHLRHSRLVSFVATLFLLPIFILTILSITHPQDLQQQSLRLPSNLNQTSRQPTTSITISQYLREQQSTRRPQGTSNHSISLIAACMNRPQSLSMALPTWEAIQEIDQIILVDWSSTKPYDIPNISNMTVAGRLSLIRVQNAKSWILSRAYNLAAKFAIGKYILKVDCDTHLDETFLTRQPLPPEGNYYTTAFGTSRNRNEKGLRGVWFGHAADFRSVGGYDERIVEYGYEDMDLYIRFDAFLDAIPLDLDSVRHNGVGDMMWRDEWTPSKRISRRMNLAMMKNMSSWSDVIEAGNESQYEYAYNNDTHILYAHIKRTPLAVHEELGNVQVQRMKTKVIQTALHDDYNVPWIVVESLELLDLEYLASYVDDDQARYIIMAKLEGSDTLSNIFNLVSVLQLGITTGRPVVAIWSLPNNMKLSQLLDIDAINEGLRQVIQSVTARRHGFSKISRLMVCEKVGCEDIGRGVRKDTANSHWVETEHRGFKVFDERDPLPLPTRYHAFVRLGNDTRLGGTETRALAFECVKFRKPVLEKVNLFDVPENNMLDRSGSKGSVQTGAHISNYSLRRFCGEVCGIEEIATEMANIVAVVQTARIQSDIAFSRERWEEGFGIGISEMMIADLRNLRRLNQESRRK